MGKQILIASLLVLLVSLVAVHPVLAATITNPTSISVTSVQVVRNVIETGDICVAFHYNIAYTAYPTTVWASDSFSLNFYNTNGVTVLSPTNPYVYIDNGYNDNLGGFYFNAAAAASMTWGAAYKIGIIPNPADFSSPPANYYYTLQSTDYTTKTTQGDNQTVIQTYLSNTCVLLEQVYSGLSLLVSSDVGEVLSVDGENWLRGALPGVASFAPHLFYTQYYVPQAETTNYNNSLGTTYANRSARWDINTGLNWLAAQTGLDSAGTVAAFIFVIISLVFTVFCAWKGWGVEPGLLGSMMNIECGGLLFGGSLFNMVLFAGLLGGIFIFYIVLMRRA